MSALDDITINGVVYTFNRFLGLSNVLRINTPATQISGTEGSLLQISHEYGTGNKPNRHMFAFTTNVNDASAGKIYPFKLHVVATLPKTPEGDMAWESFFSDTTNGLGKDVVELISLGTDFDFMSRFIGGGFA